MIIIYYRHYFEISIHPAQITAVNLDPCLKETCTNGGCTRRIRVPSHDQSHLVAANRTSLLGVNVQVERECNCPAKEMPKRCTADTCFNGGVCHNVPDGFL